MKNNAGKASVIKAFEGARGLAALFVAWYHVNIGSSHLAVVRGAYLFVDFFFVLSGFVIASAYTDRLGTPPQIKSFFIRRFGRLFPLLVFSTLCFLLAANALRLAKHAALALGYGGALAHPGELSFIMPGLPEALATMTMTQGLGFFDRLALSPVSWSISTEFHTYLLFALLCFLLRGRARIAAFALLAVGALALAIRASVVVHDCLNVGNCYDLTYDWGMARCVASVLIGALLFHGHRYVRVNADRWQAIALAVLAGFFYLAGRTPAVALASPLVFALAVFVLASDTGFAARMLQRPFFQMLGQRSYSVYMMHPALLFFFTLATKPGHGPLASIAVLLVYFVVLIVVSGWTYRWVEDPLRNYFNRLAARSDARVAVARGRARDLAPPVDSAASPRASATAADVVIGAIWPREH